MDRIILASASPRRRQLLEWAEIPYDQEASDDDELFLTDSLFRKFLFSWQAGKRL